MHREKPGRRADSSECIAFFNEICNIIVKWMEYIYIILQDWEEGKSVIVLGRQTMADQLYSDIKRRIGDRELVSGQKLTLRDIQKTYGVSSSPARDVINKLQRSGFLQVDARGTAFIASVDEEVRRELREIFALNFFVSVPLCYRNNKEKVLQLLKENYQEQLEAVNAPPDYRSRLYSAFINIFADNTGNSFFEEMIPAIEGKVVIAYGNYANCFGTERTLTDAKTIIEGFETGDCGIVIETLGRSVDYLEEFYYGKDSL